jgi:hypothetical protein
MALAAGCNRPKRLSGSCWHQAATLFLRLKRRFSFFRGHEVMSQNSVGFVVSAAFS